MKYFIVAGESSGDLYGARLITSLKQLDPQAKFLFVGGDRMAEAAETAPLVHCEEIAVMGIVAVLARFQAIASAGRKMQEGLLSFAPDRIVAIDSSGFNFRYLLPFAKKHFPQVPLIYYIVPKLWAWGKRRIKTLRRYCTALLVIFPFEEQFFQSEGIPTSFVGNPSVEVLGKYLNSYKNQSLQQDFVARNKRIPTSKPLIALLPGSRKQEIKENLPLMLRTVAHYYPHYTPVIARAKGRKAEEYSQYIQMYPKAFLLDDDTYALLASAEMAIVTSGTATLETALIGTPQVVCYRFKPLRIVNWLYSKVIHTPFFSLVNIIAGHKVVEELLAADATEKKLFEALEKLSSQASILQEEYREIRLKLAGDQASVRAADAIIQAGYSE
ncbi:lipid-A-disaccharide synthase [Bacteroidales bacterium KA00251]|nr:lipid-A-disaccharide synthase [Bacteroidales bacterium KA00251]